jgi:predicted Rossmann fold flavoprotein
MNRNIIIVGGGAAGFFAAIKAAEQARLAGQNLNVTILEASENILKKVRISGGGRCNVTHHIFEVRRFCENYPRGERELLSAMQRFQAKDTVAWFAERGVRIIPEADGRMFPDTNSSQTIIDCFLRCARELNINICTQHSVQSIERLEENSAGAPRFKVHVKDKEAMLAQSVMIATGSSQIGYKLAAGLGHTITELAPSLFSFKIEDALLRDLPGLSFPMAEVKLEVGGKTFKESGPLLITHWGLSGPGVLKISAWAAREMLAADYKAKLIVNWLGEKNVEAVTASLRSLKAANIKNQIGSVAPAPMAKRFWLQFLNVHKVDAEKRWADLANKELNILCANLFATSFAVLGKNRYKDEFVECGGVSLKEINFKTMESKLWPGLFFAGEVLDIDGITGGFNFQNAWTGGWIAGQNM